MHIVPKKLDFGKAEEPTSINNNKGKSEILNNC